MDKLKQYVVFAMLGCFAVMAAGWFLLVSPKRSDAADLHTQAAAQVSANAQLETQLQVLKAQAKDLPKQQAKLATVAAKIPDNPSLPALVRALVGAGQAAGVELVSMTPGTPAVVTAAPAAAAAAPAATAPRPANSTSSAGQLASIPLTLSIAGGYFQVEQFIANLESLPRSMRIISLALAPGANPVLPNASETPDDGKTLTTTVTGQVFMAANRPPTTAVAGTAAVPTTVTAPVAPAKK